MNRPEEVDQDDLLHARLQLLASGRKDPRDLLPAYRVLARAYPQSFLPRLAKALRSRSYDREFETRPDIVLSLRAEAADAARRIDPTEPRRAALLIDVLSSYQFALFQQGHRTEGKAVCEEMAAAGRLGHTLGQVKHPAYGHDRLAAVLAEEGRHGESAALRAELASSGGDWQLIAWSAELDAAGRPEEALSVFARVVSDARSKLTRNETSLAIAFWKLSHYARMLAAAGHPAQAAAARAEALTLTAELASTGERRSWSNIQAWWSTLYILSTRAEEPPATPDAPQPPFGTEGNWSPDVRHTYLSAIPALTAELTEPRPLPTLIAAHRRLTARSTLHCQTRTHLIEAPLTPLFDAYVAAATPSPPAHATALTDRALFLVAAHQYATAHEDYRKATTLLT
ncbi:hypothetical protein SRB5_34950 [Streptomyces sp. RB5]|uniref:Uncharacterized protein n=1 Tax=Streptomyces smaragdinus TaxID=2585196 RepID=A0A7K0CIN3_9ACTN|nr:hypothetical protein [Streptomyces smaragdinus]MQY13349.1 hypothetical protein [Streptomyces smaragdinus]